jgi:ABC-2 type transport system permease protein
VPRLFIMIGRVLGGATVALLQGLIVFAICLVAGFRVENLMHLPLSFVFMALIAILFTSLGTAIACLMSDFQGFQLIMNFLVMPLFFLSGSLFPLENLPAALNIVVRVDPLTYGVDGLRGALIGVSYYGASLDLLVLASTTAVLLAAGSYLFSKIQL